MKKVFVMILAALMLLSAAACGNEAPAETTLPAETVQETGRPAGPVGGVQIANPFIPCESLEEAAKIAGFPMTVDAEQPEWAAEVIIHGVQEGMIEVIYAETGDFAEGDNELRLRKASGERDISGVYGGDYTESEAVIGDHTVTLSSEGELTYMASWTQDGCSYFIRAAKGLSMEEISRWILAIA